MTSEATGASERHEDRGAVGSPVQQPVRPDPERAAFARWCRENGHGELDDMLTPLDRSLRALMWPVWQGAVAAERAKYTELFQAYSEACADGALARREVDAALPVMRIYARDNPPHEYEGATQDPHGVHAWLARNDRA